MLIPISRDSCRLLAYIFPLYSIGNSGLSIWRMGWLNALSSVIPYVSLSLIRAPSCPYAAARDDSFYAIDFKPPVLCQFRYCHKEWTHLFFQSGFHLLPILKISPNHPQNRFLPVHAFGQALCIYKNGQKNRAKTGRFSLQFLPSNHYILWFRPPNSSLFHNTASLLLPPRLLCVEIHLICFKHAQSKTALYFCLLYNTCCRF